MASLTETAFYTRKIIKYLALSLSVLIIGRMFFNLISSIWRQFHPPAPPPPTVSFNKLPEIVFPLQEKTNNLQFKLETITGSMPKLPDRAKVFFMPYLQPNLLAPDRAKNKARFMGFKTEPKIISEKIYQWIKNKDNQTKLEMNIFSGSFTYSYDWENDKTIALEKNLPGKEASLQEARNFLQRAQIIEEDILNGKNKIKYFQIQGGKLSPAISLSEANFVQIEMFRKDIENLPVLTSSPNKGIIDMLLSGNNNDDKKIVKVEFNYFPIKYDSWGTYPLKTANQAWQELKNGQGFIASWNKSNNIIIRKVYLAYFDSFKPQKFLQPIIVFEGDNNFIAYISAITDDWHL